MWCFYAVRVIWNTKYVVQNSQIGTNGRARVFNAGLLARSQFASGRSCDRPTRSRFSVVFLEPRANAELVPKFHVALHASHAALPIVPSKFRPNIAPNFSSNLTTKQPSQRHKKKVHLTHTRRTSGHCLGTFQTEIIFSCPSPHM
jgi:hypothetical protein